LNKIELCCRPIGARPEDRVSAYIWTDKTPSRAIFAAMNGICGLNYNPEKQIVPWESKVSPDRPGEDKIPETLFIQNTVEIDRVLITATDLDAEALAKVYSQEVAAHFFKTLVGQIKKERANNGEDV
jgi:hypothetical protein